MEDIDKGLKKVSETMCLRLKVKYRFLCVEEREALARVTVKMCVKAVIPQKCLINLGYLSVCKVFHFCARLELVNMEFWSLRLH